VIAPVDDEIAVAVSDYSRKDIIHIRHHSLYTPRDFDLSPYFRIVKPTIERGFDYKQLTWGDPAQTSPGEQAVPISSPPHP